MAVDVFVLQQIQAFEEVYFRFDKWEVRLLSFHWQFHWTWTGSEAYTNVCFACMHWLFSVSDCCRDFKYYSASLWCLKFVLLCGSWRYFEKNSWDLKIVMLSTAMTFCCDCSLSLTLCFFWKISCCNFIFSVNIAGIMPNFYNVPHWMYNFLTLVLKIQLFSISICGQANRSFIHSSFLACTTRSV